MMEIAKLICEYIKVLIWPATVIALFLIYRKEIIALINRIRRADLPGGISIETYPEEIAEAKKLYKEVRAEQKRNVEQKPVKKSASIPLTEANTRMINLGLSPSTTGLNFGYYRMLSDNDPNLALAGLRMEIETMLRNLAKGFKVKINERAPSGIIAQTLEEKGAITSRQAELINSVLQLCNKAVHGIKVTSNQSKEILKIAETLRDDYIAWLSWGFPGQ